MIEKERVHLQVYNDDSMVWCSWIDCTMWECVDSCWTVAIGGTVDLVAWVRYGCFIREGKEVFKREIAKGRNPEKGYYSGFTPEIMNSRYG